MGDAVTRMNEALARQLAQRRGLRIPGDHGEAEDDGEAEQETRPVYGTADGGAGGSPLAPKIDMNQLIREAADR